MRVAIHTASGGIFILTDAWLFGEAIVGKVGGKEIVVTDYVKAVSA